MPKAAAQRKVTVKAKPNQNVIVISPDAEEEIKKENTKAGETSSRKKTQKTLTSILTARSKVILLVICKKSFGGILLDLCF